MLPRFANPHLLVQETEIVSRAALDVAHDIPHVLSEVDENENKDYLAALERIVKRSLGELHVPDSDDVSASSGRRGTKAQQLNEPTLSEELIPFRLFSGSATLLSLKPRPPPKFKAMEPSYEDNDAEAALRAERAAAVAVNTSDIIKESCLPSYPKPNAKRKVIDVAVDGLPATPMVVVEIQRPQCGTSGGIPDALLKLPEKTRPSPHAFPSDGLCCPVLTASTKSLKHRRKRIRRKRDVGTEVPPHPPSFWRPLQEWGVKCRGYALGYAGSRPVPTGSTRQWTYRRDRMRKGVHA